MFKETDLLKTAKKLNKTIVFPEAGFSERVVNACRYIHKNKIAKVIMLGDESALILKYKKLKGITIINPKTSSFANELATDLFESRKHKGLSFEDAEKLIENPIYFGTMMVKLGYADGMVVGAETSTKDSLKPALQLIKGKKPDGLVSSCFILCGKNKALGKDGAMVLADCGLNENPEADKLTQITLQANDFTEEVVGIQPKIALLSYSTKGSAEGETPAKMCEVLKNIQEINSKIIVDGEMQLDAAIVPEVAKIKCPNSPLNGQANCLIFPDLTSGNIAYKSMQRFGKINAIGPITMGLKKPVNDLSRGCTPEEIVYITAITCIQAKNNVNGEL